MTRLLHLVGSATDDFSADLSRLYAAGCLAATADGYEVHVAYVTSDGRWRFPDDLSPAAIVAAPPMPVAAALERITAQGVDVMVPHLFDRPGMTHYRALFDVLGVPYVGNPPDLMALTAHKARARAVVAAAGVAVPAAQVLAPGERSTLPPPVVVKPVDADNSLGVTLVTEPAGFDVALTEAFAESDRVLVEAFVPPGREVRCGILVRDGQLQCLPLEEYALDADVPIRRHADKLRQGGSGLEFTAKDGVRSWIVDPADPVVPRVWEAARACHEALGARHYSLFDFRVDPGGEPWFLEAGLYCSFSPASVVATMAAAAGMGLPELFAAMIDEALRSACGGPGVRRPGPSSR